MKMHCNVCNKHRKSKNPKVYIFKKTLGFLLFTAGVVMNIKNI